MVLPRPSALRASSIARFVRPARYIRSAELQPWQQMLQRRSYASSHGGQGPAKTSDVPWAIGAVIGTAGGLYLALSQDASHGAHEELHEKHVDAHAEEEAKEEKKEEPKKEEPKKEEPKKEEPKKEEPKKEESKKEESKKEEKKDDAPAEQKPTEEKTESSADPAKSDKPDPRKESKSVNETSGKQEDLSNSDTRHPKLQEDDKDISRKGEGVHDTVKVKGTVSSGRPTPENEEQRGKTEQEK